MPLLAYAAPTPLPVCEEPREDAPLLLSCCRTWQVRELSDENTKLKGVMEKLTGDLEEANAKLDEVSDRLSSVDEGVAHDAEQERLQKKVHLV